MSEILKIDPQYRTTQNVHLGPSKVVEKVCSAEQKTKSHTGGAKFLPRNVNRLGEGGLRTKGFIKEGFKKQPLITVITVVLNGRDHLEETVLSVLNQTYQNVEYIIIDGGSTDGTVGLIQKHQHAIDYWVSETDDGIYAAMQKGVDTCTGEYLIFLNAGDLLHQTAVMTVAEKISDLKREVIVCGVNKWRNTETTAFPAFQKYHPFIGRLPCHQSMFIATSIQNRLGFDDSLKLYADQDFKLRAFACKIDFIFVDEVFSFSALGGLSQRIKSFNDLSFRTKETYKVFKKNYGLIWGVLYSLIFFFWNSRKLFYADE